MTNTPFRPAVRPRARRTLIPVAFEVPDHGGGHRTAFGVPPRRTRVLAVTLVIIVVLVAAFLLFDSLYTSYLWYRSIGAAHVYRTRLATQAALALVFGALMTAAVGANIWLAHRFRPPLTGVSLEQQALDRYRLALGPYLAWILPGVSVLLGIAAGAGATGAWRVYLMWADGVPFGTADAQFHKDIGFYVFTLPWLRHIQGFLLAVVVLSLIAALLTHYLFAGVALTPPNGERKGPRATRAAQVHISLLLGCLVLVKAYAYWLDRYALTVASSDITDGWSGPTYTSVHAVLPAKTILLVIAVLCAVLFFGNAVRLIVGRRLPEIDRGGHPWALPALGVSLMVLASVLIGGVYPLVMQQFRVNPSQASKEAPFIGKNIDATRTAFGVNGVEPDRYDATVDATRDQLTADAATVARIPVMDPAVVSAAFDHLQQESGFYDFADTLTVDRYSVDGETQNTMLGVRRLNLDGLPADRRNWVNDHLKYTHGSGVVAARADAAGPGGAPDVIDHGSSATGAFGDYEQRIYFGDGLPDYSIVDGDAGVPIGSSLKKLLYAVKFQDPKILLSDALGRHSRIVYDRDPKQRVRTVAPWLTVDGTAYPVVVGGRVQWVVDGYTTTSAYPSATRGDLGGSRVNYVRNSVKATVDAYDGTVRLYAWDDSDPILKAWMKAFPGTVEPRSAISPDLLAHLRYPQDLFQTQRDILGRYHVTDPQEFFTGSSSWAVPDDPTKSPDSDRSQPQPPYYLTVQLPGQTTPSFSLTSALVPAKGGTLAAYMAVDSDPGPDYGKIRILELSPTSAVPTPEQIQATFQSTFAYQLTARAGSTGKIIDGNLLTLPVGHGLLFVEPVYVQPLNGQSGYPLLNSVMAAFGDKVAFAPTLQQALDQIFAGESGATTGEHPPSAPTAADQLRAALADAVSAQNDAATALAKQPADWTAYGEAQKRLADALARAQALEAGQEPPK